MDWLVLAAVYLLALWARWPILPSHPYTAEAAHYVIADRLWGSTPGALTFYNDYHTDYAFLFWQRPLFSLLLAPGAAVGFEAYRLLHVLVSSLLPVLAVALLARMGTARWAAWPVGAVLAIHPLIVPWGVLVLPDSLMAVLALAGLLAAHDGRPRLAAVALLAACWTKEVAVVTVLPLLVLALWRDPDGQRSSLFPLRLTRWSTSLALVAALAFLPLLFSLSRPGAAFPGWGVGGDSLVIAEKLLLNPWLLPAMLLALALPRSRRLGLVAVAWFAFFLAYHLGLGRAVEAWYVVLPATLCLMAAAAGLSAAWEAWPRPRRLAAPAAATLLLVLLLVQAFVPQGNDAKALAAAPLSRSAQWSLAEAQAYEEIREDWLFDLTDQVAPEDRVLAVDLDWSFVLHPLLSAQSQVYVLDSRIVQAWSMDVRVVADGLERRTDAALVHKLPTAFDGALLEVYADCIVAENPAFALIRPAGCTGRAQALEDAYLARL